MKSLIKKTAAVGLALSVTACANQQNTNKEIALGLLELGIVKFDRDYIFQYTAPEYRQHNPVVADGRAGLLDFIDLLERQQTEITITPIRIIAENDLVMIHQQAQVNGAKVAIDLFKVKNNKVVEHWDVIQDEITDTVSGRSMTGGSSEIKDLDKTAENKQRVSQLIDALFINGKQDAIDKYIAKNYIQHSPFVPEGREGLKQFINDLTNNNISFGYTKMHNIVAEGNFVFTQSEGVFDDQPTAFSDLWRLEDGMIVEHWDAVQTIPTEFAHDNGMF